MRACFLLAQPLNSRTSKIALGSGAVVHDVLFLALAEELTRPLLPPTISFFIPPHGSPYAHLAYSLVDIVARFSEQFRGVHSLEKAKRSPNLVHLGDTYAPTGMYATGVVWRDGILA
jgi:hypothetical protein